MFHGGDRRRTTSLITSIPQNSCEREELLGTVEPSSKPVWTAAKADRKPLYGNDLFSFAELFPEEKAVTVSGDAESGASWERVHNS